jgi:hypothetical protein
MVKSEIKILITVIGIYNDHVIQFLKEKPGIEKVYIIHKISKEQDFRNPEKKINFKTKSATFIRNLKKNWPEVEIIPKILKNSQNIHEPQEIIRDILDIEKEKDPTLVTMQEVALDFSGGTGIMAAAQVFAAFRLAICPYYVQPKSIRRNDRVEKISINYNLGRSMGKKANEILKLIAKSTFTIKPKDHFETPEGEDPNPIPGMITLIDLNRKYRRVDSILDSLEQKNLIEKLHEYTIYHNISDNGEESEWEERKVRRVAYKITDAGKDEVNILGYQDK